MTKACTIPILTSNSDAEELFAEMLDALDVVLDDDAPPAERVQACGLWLDVAMLPASVGLGDAA